MIISVKVRTDYAADSPPLIDRLDYNFSRYGHYIYFDVLLYDKNGTVDEKGLHFVRNMALSGPTPSTGSGLTELKLSASTFT